MIKRTRTRLALVLVTVAAIAYSSTAFAEGGDGSGNRSGIVKPLGLLSAMLEDGRSIIDAQEVPLKPKIALKFDRNVVGLLYWARNKRCIHLYGSDDDEPALTITKVDDTVDFSKKQFIWVEPLDALSPGKDYLLLVDPRLVAKNGFSTLAMTTENKGVRIRFRTME